MRKIALFVEDAAHETVLKALIMRLSREFSVPVQIDRSSVRGGRGKMIHELQQYLRDLKRGGESLPDLLIVAICSAWLTRITRLGSFTRRCRAASVVGDHEQRLACWTCLTDSRWIACGAS